MNSTPRLADFIESRAAEIIDECVAFAATQVPNGVHLDAETLKDHIPEILSFVANDLRTQQTVAEQRAKSEGQNVAVAGTKSAANTHGRLRAKSGFNVDQMVAEYRALRASVLRLWIAQGLPGKHGMQDMVRFNEAIDQAIAESVADFSAEAEAWRQVFLGVLGHDLRGPLSVIMLTSELMQAMTKDTPYVKQTELLVSSGRRMNKLLDDLLDYSRTALGMGIRINRAPGDLAAGVEEEIRQLRVAFPNIGIELDVSSEIAGSFDISRVREALNNLVSNAAKYGAPNTVVRVSLRDYAQDVHLIVENEGTAMSANALNEMFEPMKRGNTDNELTQQSLGLGLFIVREIAKAHGGEVTVTSANRETSFTMRLARQGP